MKLLLISLFLSLCFTVSAQLAYVPVPVDTACNTIPDSIPKKDTVRVHDTFYVKLHDTLYVNVPYAIHDTSYVNIHDTTYVKVSYPIHDTSYVKVPYAVHDTIYKTTKYYHDTVRITIHDTLYGKPTMIIQKWTFSRTKPTALVTPNKKVSLSKQYSYELKRDETPGEAARQRFTYKPNLT